MSYNTKKTHNLDDEPGEEDSLRALIRSIVPEAATNSNGKYSVDVVDKLAEKLTELMGPAAFGEPAHQGRTNDKGELVNEDGLPIIDINENEPADATQFQYTASRPAAVTVEPLLPLASLPPPAREQLRTRRNRILDQLEEEERNAELAEEQRERQEIIEEARKRSEQDHSATDKARAARELQKKMGRALIQNVGKAKEQEKAQEDAQRIRDEEADKRKSPTTKKKSVAFVDSPEAKLKVESVDSEASSKPLDWGDIAPGRLRSSKRPTLMAKSLLDKHPMKMNVVERVPGGTPTIVKPAPPPTSRFIDSDDESEPEQPSDSDTEIGYENDEETTLDEDVVDLDYAQMQREITLEYYEKRNQIGEAATTALMNHNHDEDERMGTAPEIVHESAKPAISQFRASKLASAYNASTQGAAQESSSTSLGASILPASSTRTIQKAIRTGKLDDDGKLIGGEDDSADEAEDQGLQDVLDLLRKGEVYNLGPDGKYLHVVRPNPNAKHEPNNTATPTTTGPVISEPSSSHTVAPALPPPSARPKTSKFKAARAAAGRPEPSTLTMKDSGSRLAPSVDMLSPSVTPVSHAGRSSPKMESSPVPIASVVSERTPSSSSSIRSPVPEKASSSTSPFSMIVESPSFPHRPGSHADEHPYDTDMAAINAETSGGPGRAGNQRRLQRPPTVIATTVLEAKPRGSNQSDRNGSSQPERKVSRFMSERM